MLLSIRPKDFNPHHIIINERTKNNIMPESDFYRLIFSDEYIATNGLFINFSLKNINVEKYFNKIKCNFNDSTLNGTTISSIKSIEKMILNKFLNIKNNTMTCRIYEQLQNRYIKLYPNERTNLGTYTQINFLLKISGIWVCNDTKEYGLTFRFFIINNQF